MDLTRRLLAVGFRRPRVLLVQARDGAAGRMQAEAWMTTHGWERALSPADSDVLLVAGSPGLRLTEQLDLVWRQMPGPRARASVLTAAGLEGALLGARDRLCDLRRQLTDATEMVPQRVPVGGGGDGEGANSAAGHNSHDMSGIGTNGGPDAEMGGMDTRKNHPGHGMGATDMPGGLGMAGPADDRDGLRLDTLHVELGPVLPYWPAGVLATLTLQGDVVQDSRLRHLDGDEPGPHHLGALVTALDRAVAVLRLAGSRWAVPAQALRQRALEGKEIGADLEGLRDRVRRDRCCAGHCGGCRPPGPTTFGSSC